jgi:NADPH:quinone reductase-like Zn-dependent oxidoreductase
MATNTAAYLVKEKEPLVLKSAPYPEPGEYEIVVKNKAVAMNPVDLFQQSLGPAVIPWLKLPSILGYDVSGEVAAVGSGVSKFKVGDRVAGHSHGTFQQFVAVKEHMATVLPDSLPFEQAAVVPLCFGVAVKSLFHPEYLALDPPSAAVSKPKGETILIWGGSTSVGCNVIQLAKAAGYEVITTASPANFDYLKKLGASYVFDYNSASIKEDLLAAVQGKTVAGAIANGGVDPATYPEIVNTCAAVALSSPENRKFVPLTMVPRFPLPEGVETKFVEPVEGDKELASSMFNDYLSKAYEEGSFVCAPEPVIAGKGLESIQTALDMLSKGVSAKKVVVTI